MSFAYSSINTQIVLAKLAPPSLPHEYVTRQHANHVKKRALRNKIVVIVAPEGSGKTSLMREWQLELDAAEELMVGTAWLSVDSPDENPVRFWSHFIEAVNRAFRSVFYEDPDQKSDSTKRLEMALSNHMYRAAKGTSQQVIFIDDLNAIPESAQDEFLQFAYDYLPDTSCLVVTCTKIPDVLQNFRYTSGICILDMTDLLLSEDETIELVKLIVEREIKQDTLDEVVDLSLGWPMGVCFLANTLANNDIAQDDDVLSHIDRDRHLESFFQSYLSQKDFEPIQDFIVNISLCDTFCSDLCNAMTASTDAEQKIEYLVERQLIFPSPDRRMGWYRFHPLLRTWLRAQLALREDSYVLALADRASEWFKKKGGGGASGELAKLTLVASDADSLESLVSLSGFEPAYVKGDFFVWACNLNSSKIADRFLPSLYTMWAYYLSDDAEKLRVWLKNFRRAALRELGPITDKQHRRTIEQMADLIKIKSRQCEGNYDDTTKELQRFIDMHDDMQPSMSCLAFHALGEAYERTGNFEDAYTNYLRAEAFADTIQSIFYKMYSLYSIAWVQMMSGDINKARATCLSALAQCPKTLALHGALLDLLAYTQVETLEFEDAEYNLNEALSELSPVRNTDMWLEAQIVQARLLAAKGQLDAAYSCIVSTMAPYENVGMPRGMLLFASIERARIDIARNDLEDAKTVVASINTILGYTDVFYSLKLQIIRILINYLENNENDAPSKFEKVGADAKRHGFNYIYLETLIWKALVHDRRNEASSCFSALYEALGIAAPQSAINPFVQRGTRLPILLHTVANLRQVGHVERAFARTILSVVYKEDETLKDAETSAVLLAHLTTREQDILRLLNAGMSRKEMASKLGVSINTVKTHVSNIYSKLGVTSRTEAFVLTCYLEKNQTD